MHEEEKDGREEGEGVEGYSNEQHACLACHPAYSTGQQGYMNTFWIVRNRSSFCRSKALKSKLEEINESRSLSNKNVYITFFFVSKFEAVYISRNVDSKFYD